MIESERTVKLGSGVGAVSVEPALTAVSKFCRDTGIHPCTHWRWVQRGWIAPPIDIAGRKYHARADIERFLQRAAAGEFAAKLQPPQRVRKV